MLLRNNPPNSIQTNRFPWPDSADLLALAKYSKNVFKCLFYEVLFDAPEVFIIDE